MNCSASVCTAQFHQRPGKTSCKVTSGSCLSGGVLLVQQLVQQPHTNQQSKSDYLNDAPYVQEGALHNVQKFQLSAQFSLHCTGLWFNTQR